MDQANGRMQRKSMQSVLGGFMPMCVHQTWTLVNIDYVQTLYAISVHRKDYIRRTSPEEATAKGRAAPFYAPSRSKIGYGTLVLRTVREPKYLQKTASDRKTTRLNSSH